MATQTVAYSLEQYLAAGCITLMRDGKIDLIGAGIHGATGGMPCNGCFMLRMNCPAFAKLRGSVAAIVSSPQPTETVRQEATRRGLSIGEVRRQRRTVVAVDASGAFCPGDPGEWQEVPFVAVPPEPGKPPLCCGGGPQWGHAWDCPRGV